MTDTATTVSLKGEIGTWSGLGDETTMLPGPATFATLDGCYISKDGTEIRRIPGSRLGGRPFYGQEWAITNITGTTTWTVTLDASNQDGSECYLPTSFVCYFVIAGETTLHQQYVVGTKASANTFTVTGDGGSPGATTGTVLIQRLEAVHGMTHVGDRVVGICETSVYAGATERTNVATCVSSGPLDFDSPVGPGVRDTYANETGFIFWPTPTMTGMTVGEREYGDGLNVAAAQNVTVYRRIQHDVLNKRVVLAVPGSGILYQANIGGGPPWQPVTSEIDADLPDHRWTKMLGIPRGVIQTATTSDSAGSLTAGKWYGIAVGYWDPFTQEVGAASEVWAVQTGGGAANPQLDVTVARPRWANADCQGLGIILYVTDHGYDTRGEAETGLLLPYEYNGPWATDEDYAYWGASGPGSSNAFISFTVLTEPDPDNQILPGRLPVFEVCPPGGGVIRVVKGRAFTGGGYPESWTMDCWTQEEAGRGTEVWLPSEGIIHGSVNYPAPCTHGIIPDGFEGYRLQRNALTVGQGRGRIDRVVNPRYNPAGSTHGWPIRGHRTDFIYGTNWTTSPDAGELDEFILSNDGLARIAFTEEAALQVSPGGRNRLDIDSISGERIQGMARVGDALLAMTERETFLFSWASAPSQSSQAVISNRYGCIAPGSVVEGPFGAAWLSHEGPVMFDGGAIRWIGSRIREFWETVQKDSKGEAHYCTATVDLERALVIWGVRVGAFSGETDIAKSKEEADTLLIWSYATGQFSTYTPSTASQPQAIATLPFTQSKMRVSWTQNDTATHYRPIYGWDEDAVDRSDAVGTLAISAARTAGSATVSVSSGGDGYLPGDQGFIRSSDGQTLKWFGAVASSTGATTVPITNDDGATWAAGDKLILGSIHQTLTTNRMRFGDLGLDNLVTGVVLRADVVASYAYAKITATNEDGGTATFTSRWGDRLKDGTTRFRGGNFIGTEITLSVTIVSDGQVRLKDIALEVQGGDR